MRKAERHQWRDNKERIGELMITSPGQTPLPARLAGKAQFLLASWQCRADPSGGWETAGGRIHEGLPANAPVKCAGLLAWALIRFKPLHIISIDVPWV